ncbi:hypothetical protein PVAND_006519 [Polypedilum vanderplanki]|uniref:Uncharacterized protein n=1 Tax=Polypedilum vanderplanki TaxID=319348 RepID=A0A9J6C3G3_POLVA|nr:hypothetical protein PVAND_006519 [Polypedilum vanderplanki]
MENNKPSRRRSSFFGYTVPQTNLETEYTEKLEKEDKEWQEYLLKTNNKFKAYWRSVRENNVKNDGKIELSKERNDYLDKKIDMQKFKKEHTQFVDDIEYYLNRKQWFFEKRNMFIDDLYDKEIEKRIKQCRMIKSKQESIHASPPQCKTE